MRALIADDSVVFRTQIKLALRDIDGVDHVEAVKNGQVAVDAIAKYSFDFLILDMEMPILDGIGTIKKLNEMKSEVKIIVFSSTTASGSQNALEATRLGAYGVILKPSGEGVTAGTAAGKIREQLEPHVLQLAEFAKKTPAVSEQSEVVERKYPVKEISTFYPDCVVVASSTGGPAVLETIFGGIKVNQQRIPIVIAQHMPAIITASLARRLSSITNLNVKEIENGEVLEPNIYICPGDYHVKLRKDGVRVCAFLDQGPRVNFVRPAADLTFESASEIYKNKTLGIVLTGMGYDGKNGSEKIKKQNGGVIIQSKSTCTVFGMAGSVKEAGVYDLEADPVQIVTELNRMVGK